LHHEKPIFSAFISNYYELNPDYQINYDVLQFYLLSRKLQDIFEFIEQLQFDELNQEEYKMNLNYLRKEVNGLKETSKRKI
jgi:spectinomycin phosphotransferase